MTQSFTLPAEDIFFKGSKTGDPRLGSRVIPSPGKVPPGQPKGVAICGYPNDEGIQLNRGRTGAALGPDAIRRQLYKTSTHQHPPLTIYDLGNGVKNQSLDIFHENLKLTAQQALDQGHYWVGLGGGHDFGYSDGAGFLNYCAELKKDNPKLKRPLILNFDAHLDVRPMDKGPSSGTPFYRLMTEDGFPDFDIAQVGVQKHCNSQEHAQWFIDRGGKILWWEDIMISGQSVPEYVLNFLNTFFIGSRPTYISVDIDGFSNAYAMGCSQSWATGWEPNSFFPTFQALLGIHDVRCLGIYEVSPPLDLDDRTSKLAAQIIYNFLHPVHQRD